jgi:hypothetical protein
MVRMPDRPTAQRRRCRKLATVRSALQQAGNLNWNNVDDPDGTTETLVNVDAFQGALHWSAGTDSPSWAVRGRSATVS